MSNPTVVSAIADVIEALGEGTASLDSALGGNVSLEGVALVALQDALPLAVVMLRDLAAGKTSTQVRADFDSALANIVEKARFGAA
jgi:hypothetical protein